MAKKKPARGEFNMSAEIRNILQDSPKLSSNEVYAQLQERFPGQEINRNSCNVAFSHARAKLGLRGGKKSVKVRRPGRATSAAPSTSASVSGESVNITLLKSARKFLAEAGSAAAAISAIQQLDALQIR